MVPARRSTLFAIAFLSAISRLVKFFAVIRGSGSSSSFGKQYVVRVCPIDASEIKTSISDHASIHLRRCRDAVIRQLKNAAAQKKSSRNSAFPKMYTIGFLRALTTSTSSDSIFNFCAAETSCVSASRISRRLDELKSVSSSRSKIPWYSRSSFDSIFSGFRNSAVRRRNANAVISDTNGTTGSSIGSRIPRHVSAH